MNAERFQFPALNGHAGPITDHATEARDMLARRPIYGAIASEAVRRGQVHATLALVERIDRLIDELRGQRADDQRAAGVEDVYCGNCDKTTKAVGDTCLRCGNLLIPF